MIRKLSSKVIALHSIKVLDKGVIEGGLYRLLVDPMKQRAFFTSRNNLCELWHRRFGHLNYGSLPPLKDMAVGFHDFKVERRAV